jgi:ketose-bisphosphate aldolase
MENLMSYVNLGEMVRAAKKGGYAVGAFNIVDFVTARAVIQAAVAKKSPVILQTSAKTVKFYGAEPLCACIIAMSKKASVPVALHLDHCKDINLIRECMDAGWSSVMYDGSELPFEENLKNTIEVAKEAHARGVTVEGELGAILGVEEDKAVSEDKARLADPEQSVEFVEKTHVDVFAPAIGTAHGIYKGEPKIAFDLLAKIAKSVDAAVAIHGGTGLSDEVFRKCISLGGAKVNISTQIKHHFRDGLEAFYKANPKEYEPLKALDAVLRKTEPDIGQFIEKFGCAGKA